MVQDITVSNRLYFSHLQSKMVSIVEVTNIRAKQIHVSCEIYTP